MLKKSISSLLLCSAISIAHAGEFSGEGGLGFTLTDGNSESQNLNATLSAKYSSGAFVHNLSVLANQAESTDPATGEETETADSIKLGYQLNYSLTEKDYLWAGYIHDSNPYAGYDPQQSISAGYGRIWIKNDITLFSTEIGFGSKETDAVEFNTATSSFHDIGSNDEGITHLAATYEHKITSNTQFIQKLLFQLGEDNDYTESLSALKVSMSEKFSLQLSYLLKKNSDIVGSNGDDTDSTTAFTVVYGF